MDDSKNKKSIGMLIMILALVVAVAVVIYFAVLVLLKGIDKKEIDLIKGMI